MSSAATLDTLPKAQNTGQTGVLGGNFMLGSLSLLVLIFIAYVPCLRGPFIMDDDVLVYGNPLIKASDGLWRFWTSTETPDYFPLTSTTLWIEWRIWGEWPAGYRIVNIVLHAMSAMLIWRILLRLQVPAAWLCAAAFALHPVNVSSVAWIAERKNTLPMVFYLASILLYLDFDRDPSRRGRYIASLIAFLLAMLAKTSVVMLPVVLLLCDWWRRDRISRADILRSIPFFIFAGVLSLVTIWFQFSRAIGDDIIRTDGPISRTIVAGCAVAFYAMKTIAPVGLSMIYPRWDLNAVSWVWAIPGIVIIVMLGISWIFRRTWGKPVIFSLGYFIATLVPVLGFLNIYFMKFSLVGDHYLYISIIGVIALVIGSVAWILRNSAGGMRVVLGVIVVGTLFVLTMQRARVFSDAVYLWADAAGKSPTSWVVWNNLGHAWIRLEHLNTDEAADAFAESLRLDPDNQEARVMLAWPPADLKAPDSREQQVRNAERLHYAYADAHAILGERLAAQGRIREALDHLFKTLTLDADHLGAHFAVGRIRLEQGRLGEAREHFDEILRRDPGNIRARNGMAIVLGKAGQLDAARKMLEGLLRDHPEFAEAHYNLAMLLETSDPAAAIEHLKRAVEINPNFTAARRKLDEASSKDP